MWETWVQSLGWEDPLEKGIATHSSVLAWRTHMDRGTWRAATYGVAESPTQLSAQAQHRSSGERSQVLRVEGESESESPV